MNPDDINSQAIRGIIGLTIIVLLVVMVGRLTAADTSLPLVAAGALEADAPDAAPDGISQARIPATYSGIPDVPSNSATMKIDPAVEPAVPAGSTPTSAGSDAAIPAMPSASPTASPGDSDSIRTAASTTSMVTTTVGPTPTTIVEPATTTVPTTTTTPVSTTTTAAVSKTSTTTLVPRTTTTVSKATTTTFVQRTTTTVPSTTTTVAPTTTTTTVSSTTTTTIALPSVFVHKYDAHEHGEAGAWEAHVQLEIRDEFDEKPSYPSVLISWTGAESGSMWLAGDKVGKADIRTGPHSAAGLIFTIESIRADGYTYRPALNVVPTSIKVEGPT